MAAEGFMLAANATDQIAKDILYDRAQMWLRSAEELEAGLIARKAPAQAQPVTQQQQQVQPKKEGE
jgi:hypothetical protein